MRKILPIAILICLFFLAGCEGNILNFFNTNTSNDISGAKFVIDAIEVVVSQERTRSRSMRDLQSSSYELWLMPVRRGWNEVIRHENVSGLKKFTITDEGSYAIPLEEFPFEDPSVVFIMEEHEEGDFKVIGFLGLKINEEHVVFEFPPRKKMLGTIEFGTVRVEENTYRAISEKTLNDNKTGFTADTVESLQAQAISQNLILMAINTLWNTQDIDTFYAPGLTFEYSMDETQSINWGRVGINVYSKDYTSSAALFDPEGNGLMSSYQQGYGPQSSVQWAAVLSSQEFFRLAEPGNLWFLATEDNRQLAAFDLSLALVMDADGNPIIPFFEPTYTTKEDDSTLVERIDLNWYYYSLDGSIKNRITSDSEYAFLIEQHSFFMDKRTGTGGTYMIRDRNINYQGNFGMKGDIFSLYDFDEPLKVEELALLSIGYRFSFFNCNTEWHLAE